MYSGIFSLVRNYHTVTYCDTEYTKRKLCYKRRVECMWIQSVVNIIRNMLTERILSFLIWIPMILGQGQVEWYQETLEIEGSGFNCSEEIMNTKQEFKKKMEDLENQNRNLQNKFDTLQLKLDRLLERSEGYEACFEDIGSHNCTGSKSGLIGIVEAIRVDGEWGPFSDWPQCSASCGGGVQVKERTCNNPVPKNGGKPCKGEALEQRTCNAHLCNGFKLYATCDNAMKIFADRNLMATNDDWTTTTAVDIPSNTNSIEVHCTDLGVVGGILAFADNGIKTDGSWSCSADGGSTWTPAYEIGPNGMSPWGVRPQIPVDAKWIWTGKDTYHGKHTNVICKITVGFKLHATCDNTMKILADGNLMATNDDWKETTAVDIPSGTKSVEVHCTDLGVVGGILASADNGIKTDGSWLCSADGGSTWTPAYEIGPNGMSPWRVRPQIPADAKWIWTGKDTYHGEHANVVCKITLG